LRTFHQRSARDEFYQSLHSTDYERDNMIADIVTDSRFERRRPRWDIHGSDAGGTT